MRDKIQHKIQEIQLFLPSDLDKVVIKGVGPSKEQLWLTNHCNIEVLTPNHMGVKTDQEKPRPEA